MWSFFFSRLIMDRMPLDIQLDQGEGGRGDQGGANLCLLLPSSASMTSKAMFLYLRCSGSMRGRQTISCCSRSRCVFPLHCSPNHLRLQLQLSLSSSTVYPRARARYIRPALAAERLECAVVMKGVVAAWVFASGLSSQPVPEQG
jgi:hypothetical protein